MVVPPESLFCDVVDAWDEEGPFLTLCVDNSSSSNIIAADRAPTSMDGTSVVVAGTNKIMMVPESLLSNITEAWGEDGPLDDLLLSCTANNEKQAAAVAKKDISNHTYLEEESSSEKTTPKVGKKVTKVATSANIDKKEVDDDERKSKAKDQQHAGGIVRTLFGKCLPSTSKTNRSLVDPPRFRPTSACTLTSKASSQSSTTTKSKPKDHFNHTVITVVSTESSVESSPSSKIVSSTTIVEDVTDPQKSPSKIVSPNMAEETDIVETEGVNDDDKGLLRRGATKTKKEEEITLDAFALVLSLKNTRHSRIGLKKLLEVVQHRSKSILNKEARAIISGGIFVERFRGALLFYLYNEDLLYGSIINNDDDDDTISITSSDSESTCLYVEDSCWLELHIIALKILVCSLQSFIWTTQHVVSKKSGFFQYDETTSSSSWCRWSSRFLHVDFQDNFWSRVLDMLLHNVEQPRHDQITYYSLKILRFLYWVDPIALGGILQGRLLPHLTHLKQIDARGNNNDGEGRSGEMMIEREASRLLRLALDDASLCSSTV